MFAGWVLVCGSESRHSNAFECSSMQLPLAVK